MIEKAERVGSYGNYLRIRHMDTYMMAYAHLHRFARTVKPGTAVKQGQIIGYAGATGPHLHYELIKNDQQVIP